MNSGESWTARMGWTGVCSTTRAPPPAPACRTAVPSWPQNQATGLPPRCVFGGRAGGGSSCVLASMLGRCVKPSACSTAVHSLTHCRRCGSVLSVRWRGPASSPGSRLNPQLPSAAPLLRCRRHGSALSVRLRQPGSSHGSLAMWTIPPVRTHHWILLSWPWPDELPWNVAIGQLVC